MLPKVLIISHNSLNDFTNNGRTLLEFFSGWESEKIAQLYFKKELPSNNACKNYYRITDFDMMDSVLKCKKAGRKIKIEEFGCEEHCDDRERYLYEKGSMGNANFRISREVIWQVGRWRTKDLFCWIEEFKPEVIFYVSGDFVFSQKIVFQLSQKYNLPIVSFIGDDYYFLKDTTKSVMNKIQHCLLKRSIIKLSKCSAFITASEKMEHDYIREFKNKCYTIMTSSNIKPNKVENINNKFIISYFGNISLNRYDVIIKLARIVNKINNNVELNVYSNEGRETILNKIRSEPLINFKGGIAYEEVRRVMLKSDLLIHCESFEPEIIEKIKYSMSTKIADSLSSGILFLGFGPKESACMQYLRENELLVANNEDELVSIFKQNVFNTQEHAKIIEKQLAVAKKNHNEKTNFTKLLDVLRLQIEGEE